MSVTLVAKPAFDYPKGFTRLEPLEDQVRALAHAARSASIEIDLTRALGLAREFSQENAPKDSEGFLARFRPGLWGVHHHSDVSLAAEVMFHHSATDSRFRDTIDPTNFRLDPFTGTVLEGLVKEQQSDIIFHPAQAGRRYASHTDEEVRARFGEETGEFGIDFLGAISLLIGNPKRLCDPQSLWLSCPAEQHFWVTTGTFVAVPVLGFQVGVPKMFIRPADWPNSADHGAVTGFIYPERS